MIAAGAIGLCGWGLAAGSGPTVGAVRSSQPPPGSGVVTYQRGPITRSSGHATEVILADEVLSWTEGVFHPLVPCRIIDTRSTPAGALKANTSRAFVSISPDFSVQGGSDTDCGVPNTATAVQMNVTSAESTGNGNIRVYPFGEAAPTASLVNFRAGVPIANAANVALCREADGRLCLNDMRFLATAPTHLIIDVLGYYEPVLAAQVNYDGSVFGASLALTSVAHLEGAGSYEVIFDRDVSSCVVSTESGGEGINMAGLSVSSEDRVMEPRGVYVEVYDDTGALVDASFQIHLHC